MSCVVELSKQSKQNRILLRTCWGSLAVVAGKYKEVVRTRRENANIKTIVFIRRHHKRDDVKTKRPTKEAYEYM